MNPTASSARKIQSPLEFDKPKESVWRPSGRAKSKEIFSSAFIYINIPYKYALNPQQPNFS